MAAAVVAAGSTFLTCAALEVSARGLVHSEPFPSPRYAQLLSRHPRAEEHLASLRAINGRLAYHDWHLYSLAPIATPTIRVLEDGSRYVPASRPDGPRLWLFGGSTMQNCECPDEDTIANTVAQSWPGPVHNYGVGSFSSSHELAKLTDLLRRAAPCERPAMVVFYDGYNDALNEPGQSALSGQFEVLVTGHGRAQLGLALLSESIGEWSAAWRRWVASPPVQRREPEPDRVAVYEANVRMAAGACEALGIQFRAVLQPLVITKEPRSRFEEETLAGVSMRDRLHGEAFYAGVRQRLGSWPSFVDLSHCLDGRKEDDFYDFGHTSPFTGRAIGAALADALLGRGR